MTDFSPGFTEPTEAQSCFRAVLQALSRPGEIVTVATGLVPPAPLSPAAGALLLTLADPAVGVSLAGQGPADWLVFHAGARIVPAAQADFVLARTLPDLSRLKTGTDDEPEGGAMVILDVESFDSGLTYRLTGPGIARETLCRLPVPENFAAVWRANRQLSPRGVDLLLCVGEKIIGLPRSVTIEEI
jgi:alpha-D-ribose 1-methylphosphonate 5-triphosphate synthase subunit PhnH